ncbi:hypothetical protein [Nocardioides astragali]|uniref:DUF3558 domain-containing protein n=1 Tax=Nocardioides astragali TaxID=1776736 RepID=A0ABW2MZD4_9ACTN|nr:hypothetical protein [Nocardioides astragali]
MVSRASCVALGLVGMLLVGCGDRSDPATSSPDATSPEATTEAAPPALDQYLLKADEVPDLAPYSSPQTDSGEPFDLPESGADLLRRSGYISTTYQPADGARGAGVSSVLLFETDAGARDWMAYETSDEGIQDLVPGTTIKRFDVPGVPGATGWTGSDLHGNAIGHVYWTQGRCMLLIGLEVEGPRVRRLSAGVEAIYERTGGTCPE